MFALDVGLRYLRSKKRSTVTTITFIAVTGVALGVAALLAVLSITSGFQDEFRNKVLGVNAHVLVLKYGLDFEEYREVGARAEEMPEVIGAGPFVINQMMLANGDRLAGVLVKGIDPEAMPTVLDLPGQIVRPAEAVQAIKRLRLPGVGPAQASSLRTDGPLDRYLRKVSVKDAGQDSGHEGDDAARLLDQALTGAPSPARGETAKDGEPSGEAASGRETALAEEIAIDAYEDDAPLPEVTVPSLAEATAALSDLETALPDDDFERALFEDDEADGAATASTEPVPGIVVGVTLAEQIGVDVGDRVRLISPLSGLDTSMWSAEARTPSSREFEVTGIFQAGFQEYDSTLVYLDLYEAQRFFDGGDTVRGVEIKLNAIDRARDVASALEAELGAPFYTMDWESLNHNLFTALKIQKVMLSLVIATIILVAAFNVIATLIMIVLEKKREVAILKAMGATDGSVLTIFMIQGVIIGVVGTVLGLIIGGGIVMYLDAFAFPLDPKVYLIDHLPVRVNAEDFVWTTIIALAICTLATVIPSLWAARMLPAHGVRYE